MTRVYSYNKCYVGHSTLSDIHDVSGLDLLPSSGRCAGVLNVSAKDF